MCQRVCLHQHSILNPESILLPHHPHTHHILPHIAGHSRVAQSWFLSDESWLEGAVPVHLPCISCSWAFSPRDQKRAGRSEDASTRVMNIGSSALIVSLYRSDSTFRAHQNTQAFMFCCLLQSLYIPLY